MRIADASFIEVTNNILKVHDPLEPLISFQNFHKNGLNIQLVCKRKTDLKDEDLKWVFNLTKRNMEDM